MGPVVRCGLAAAICIGANGKIGTHTVDLGVEGRSLLEGDASASSTSRYSMQSSKLVDELEKLMKGNKELPASIKAFIDMIKVNAGEIQTKLVDEHAIQKDDLDNKFNAFATCETTLTAAVANANSQQTLATTAETDLCSCWNDQSIAKLNSQGCQGELTCRNDDVAVKLEAQTAFLLVDSNTPVDQYKDSAGTDLCGNSAAWENEAGASDSIKALAWFDKQRVGSTTHWNGKQTALQSLINAHKKAKHTRYQLKTGIDAYAGKGCDELKVILGTKETACTTKKGSAELAYCNYYNVQKNACDAYEQCRDAASAAWEAAKVRETRDSQDRKDAWVSAGKVKCLVNSFSDDSAGSGNIQIDTTASQACSTAITCDAACIAALDLSVSLARVPPSASPCVLPAPTPPCTCDESSWPEFSPLYFVGARTGSQCHVAAVPTNPATAQVTAACVQCAR